jgi:hypothetical protein
VIRAGAGFEADEIFLGVETIPQRARQIFRRGFLDLLLFARFVTEALQHDSRRIKIDLLIDAGHDAIVHQLADDVDRAHFYARGQIAHTDDAGYFHNFFCHPTPPSDPAITRADRGHDAARPASTGRSR